MTKGRLFILSGPSGSGKDTVLAEVIKARPDIKVSVSCVTRAMRVGESEGYPYHFVSRDAFLEMINSGELLEYNDFCGNYYGTPKAPVDYAIENGKDFILKIDVNGAAKVKELVPDAIRIFIVPPSFEVLKQRLRNRGSEDEAQLGSRIKAAVNEIRDAVNYDYIVVNNDLSAAVEDVLDIINCDRLKTDRNIEFLNGVINHVE